MRILENSELRIGIADKGAELSSVVDKATGGERLWTADPAVWNRHAPILFPFVGKLTGGKYRIGGREYPMKTQHGFARDLPFACEEETGDCVRHALAATEDTKAVYPYDFRLRVTHALDGDNPRQLNIGWRVENAGDAEMLFSIGGHPGFLLPPGVDKRDCFIRFPGRDALSYFNVNAAGFALPENPRRLTLDGGLAPYGADMPDTWIFAGQDIREVGIALPDGKPYVTLRCGQFPMLGVWANPNGPFICLEPWFGRTDDVGFAGTIAEKPGIQRLAPGAAMEMGYSIEFHSACH